MESIKDLDKKKREGISLNPDLVFPNRIYGREKEQERFLNAIEQFEKGGQQLLQVIGEPGIGKSFFVHHLCDKLTQFEYHFGKYERFQQGVPYLGIRQLIESIIRSNKEVSNDHFDKWLTEMRFRFTENYAEFVTIVPSAIELWDVQMDTKVEQGSPMALQNRINRFLSNFFKFVVAKSQKSIMLHLDDLQWCDNASRRFILRLADKEMTGLLIVLASRPPEISNEKVKDELVAQLSEHPNLKQIALSPLSRLEVRNLLEEIFPKTSSDIHELLDVTYDQSSGNPYALNESLVDLNRNGKLVYNSKDNSWNWKFKSEEKPSEEKALPGLLRNKLFDLKDEYQRILQIASCFGTNLNIPFISRISGVEQHVLRSTFQQAIPLGFLIQSPASGHDGVPEMSNYEFAHDMAQESVYSTLDLADKKRIHKKIATYFIEGSFLGLSDRDVFDAVYHLNESHESSWTREEIQRHADVNLRAAKKAHSAASFSLALNYLKQVLAHGEQNEWKYHYSFAAEAHIFGYKIARLNNDVELAKELYKNAKESLEPLELAKLRLRKTMMDIQFGELSEALKTGVKALKDLEIHVPKRAGKIAVAKEFLRTKMMMRGKTLESIYELPKMNNVEAETAFEIIFWMFRAAHSSNPELNGVLALKELQLTLKHGTNGASYSGLMAYGVIIGAGTNNYKSAFEYCDLGSRLAIKYKNKSGAVQFGRAISMAYRFPLRETLKNYELAKKLSFDQGDFLAAAEPTVNESLTFYSVGMPLPGVEIKVQENRDYCKSLHMTDFYEFQVATLHHVKRIKGDHLESINDVELKSIMEKTEYNVTLAACGVFMMQYESLRGNWKKVVELSKIYRKEIQFISGLYFQTEYYFYKAVAKLKMYDSMGVAAKVRAKKQVGAIKKKMYKWAASAPENHGHRVKIIEGLLAHANGSSNDAEQMLKEAAVEAQEHIFTQNAALAHWFLFDLYAEKGKTKEAQMAYANAMELFSIWGTKLVG